MRETVRDPDPVLPSGRSPAERRRLFLSWLGAAWVVLGIAFLITTRDGCSTLTALGVGTILGGMAGLVRDE